MKTHYWVPENMMFDNAGDCLDKCPNDGAAALVVSHVAYDDLIKRINLLRESHRTNADSDYRGNRSSESVTSWHAIERDNQLEKLNKERL